jgi:hypothetical protein
MGEDMEIDTGAKGGKEGEQVPPKKVKADDDPEQEGEWMKLADLRYRIVKYGNIMHLF